MKIIIITLILGILLGCVGTMAYIEFNNEKVLNGLWISGMNKTRVTEYIYDRDDSGQWVCINIDDKMTYQEIIDTCKHEASHELFARKCTEDTDKCMRLIE